RRHQAGGEIEQGGLSRAGRTENGDDLAGADLEGDVAQDLERTIPLRKSLGNLGERKGGGGADEGGGGGRALLAHVGLSTKPRGVASQANRRSHEYATTQPKNAQSVPSCRAPAGQAS